GPGVLAQVKTTPRTVKLPAIEEYQHVPRVNADDDDNIPPRGADHDQVAVVHVDAAWDWVADLHREGRGPGLAAAIGDREGNCVIARFHNPMFEGVMGIRYQAGQVVPGAVAVGNDGHGRTENTDAVEAKLAGPRVGKGGAAVGLDGHRERASGLLN